MASLASPTGGLQTDKKRTGSASGKARPGLPPPPPPPPSSHADTPDATLEVKENNADNVDKLSSCDYGKAQGQTLEVNVSPCGQNQGQHRSDFDSKSRNTSTSSTESGGKSPRPNFRKSRPAPLPPKPKTASESNGDSASANVPLDVTSLEKGSVNSNSDEITKGNSNTVQVANSASKTSILTTKGQVSRNKSLLKPSAPPPQPPPKSPLVKQTAAMGAKSGEAVPINKPVILSPKPKIKPCAPPPPPPNRDACLHDESSAKVEDTANDPPQENGASDLSDIMKDVLGVIDRGGENISRSETEKQSVSIVSDTTMASKVDDVTSENISRVKEVYSPNNDNNMSSGDLSKVDQSSDEMLKDSNIEEQTITDAKTDATTELTIEIPRTPEESHPSPSLQKPSVTHTRGTNSPRRPVRRRKTALGLMLCCGLGKAFLRDKNSPPFELPLRTEGTLPRGENLVQSVSLSSDLMRASHSPKKLEQSDVTTPVNSATNNDDVLINSTSDVTVKENDVISISGIKTGSDVKPVSNDITVEATKTRDIIDFLCESEKPISINKLQGDNKDLVVTSESASSSLTNIDVTTRPVVHGVKLSKVEKSSTFTSFANSDNQSRPATPRLLKAGFEVSNRPVDISNHFKDSSENAENVLKIDSNVSDIKLRKDSQSRTQSRAAEKVRSQSMEDLSCLVNDLDVDLTSHIKRAEGHRSSFIGEDVKSKPALTRAPGEVQTLLKHTKEGEDKVYALPQPACYGDDTLKAVKLITDKYDTLERWKIRAVSFRGDGTVRRDNQNVDIKISPASRQNSTDSKTADVIPEVLETDQSDGRIPATSEEDNNTSIIDTPPQAILPQNDHELKAYELNQSEIARIKLFYGSYDTEVSAANSVVDLLLSAKEVEKAGDVKEWTHAQTGVPVLVLNMGNRRGRRELTITLADRDTSFPLWTDKINYLSQYGALSETLHTMHLSSSLMKIAAFQFHNAPLAEDFMNKFKEITKDPNDDLWKVFVDSKKPKKKKAPSKVPVKGDISQPINFDHVTRVSAHDQNLAMNLAEFIPNNNKGHVDSDFRPRAYSG